MSLNFPGRTRRTIAAFTLIELLVVIAVIVAFSVIFFGGLRGSDQAVQLQAGQSIIANGIAAARSKAMASGHRFRFLVNDDPEARERYRRLIVLIEETEPNAWVVRQTIELPSGCYVVPYSSRIPIGLFPDPASWVRYQSSTVLASSVFSTAPIPFAVGTTVEQSWDVLQFSALGTTSTSGILVLAAGKLRPPPEVATGESPVVLTSPESVRGVSISSYGLARSVNDRTEF